MVHASEHTGPGYRTSVLGDLVDRAKGAAIVGGLPESAHRFEHVYATAVKMGDWDTAADALDWLTGLAWIAFDGRRTAEYTRRMTEMPLPASEPQAFRLCIRHAFHTLQSGDPHKASEIIAKAELVSRFADVDTFGSYLSVKADICAARGECAKAIGYAELAADIASERSDRGALWLRLIYLGHVRNSCGQLAGALDAYLRAERVAVAAGMKWEVALARIRAAWLMFLLGRVNEARELVWSTFAGSESLAWFTVTRSWVGLNVALAAGDGELETACADEAWLELALGSDDTYSIVPCVAAFHEHFYRKKAYEKAGRMLEIGIERAGSPDFGWTLFGSIAAHGDASLVARARVRLSAFQADHRLAQAYRLAFDAVLAGRSGDVVRAEHHASEAQLIFEELQYAYLAARCLEIGGHVNEGRNRYAAMGALADAERMAAVCAKRGRPRKGYDFGRQRHEMRSLIVSGATNKEIAERLGVCVGTVKNRIREIYEEEGVTRRADLQRKLRG